MTSLTEQVAQEVVDPETGEVIDRRDLPAVVRLYQKIRSVEQQFRDAKRWANEAILEAMDERAEWTLHMGAFKVSAPSPTSADIEWDVDELAKLEGLLPSDRYGELVRQVVTLEPQTRALQQAARAGGEIAAIIERAMRRTAKRRYVRVS